MRRRTERLAAAPDPDEISRERARLQAELASGAVSLDAFTRAWRRLDRPDVVQVAPPDELRLGTVRKALSDFGTLWRDPAVPDRTRAEALHEILLRVDVTGPEIVAIRPTESENAWL